MNTPEQTEAESTQSRRSVIALVATGFVVLALLLMVCGGGLLVISEETRPGTRLVYSIEPGDVSAADVVEPLRRRLLDSFPLGVSVTVLDSEHVEVIVPTIDPREIDYVKRLINSGGHLRFLILANHFNHQHLFDLVTLQAGEDASSTAPPKRDVTDDKGNIVARWVTAARQENTMDAVRPLRTHVNQSVVRDSNTGKILTLPKGASGDEAVAAWMDDQGIASIDLLAVVEPTVEVTGADLAFASLQFDQNGEPAVAITFTDQVGARFFALTVSNAPRLNRYSQLGVILDDQILSAPNIIAPVRKEARITGQFTREEVDFVISVLKSGAMPTQLSDKPTSESEVKVSIGVLERLGS